MVIKRFEDIIAWQKAQSFTIEIYSKFSLLRDYSFKDQICRACISISNNIAEGFDRSSDAEFARFLYYSIGSCSEVKSMIYLADKLSYLDNKSAKKLIEDCNELSRIIRGLLKSLKKKKSS